MPLPLRDQHRHTYAEYCSWPEDVRYSVICDRTKLDDRGCRGASDWVIEVLSPSSASHDQILKRALYERHGVREYWLIHPVDLVVTVATAWPTAPTAGPTSTSSRTPWPAGSCRRS